MSRSSSSSDRSHRLTDLYDAASRSWQQSIERLGYPDAYTQVVTEAMQSIDPIRRWNLQVLDAGTGTGAFAHALAKADCKIARLDLLDPSEGMLNLAAAELHNSSPFVSAIVGRIGEVDLPFQTYDIVLCAHVIEHVDDVQACLAWFRKILKPGGQLLLVVSKPHWCTTLLRFVWGHRAYRSPKVVKMLDETGFVQMKVIPFQVGPPRRTSAGYIATTTKQKPRSETSLPSADNC